MHYSILIIILYAVYELNEVKLTPFLVTFHTKYNTIQKWFL